MFIDYSLQFRQNDEEKEEMQISLSMNDAIKMLSLNVRQET
jgi:hypothetical protein